jgi:hypothetical protein
MVSRLILIGLLIAACGPVAGDTASPSPSSGPVAIGDPCLVGRWVEKRQFSAGNFGLGTGERFTVTGLEGFVISYAADGTETDDFKASQPLNGGWRGNQIQIVIAGSITYQDHAEGGFILQSKPVGRPTLAFYANNTPMAGGTSSSSFAPANISYTCAGSFLHLETPSVVRGYGPQTDDLTRG